MTSEELTQLKLSQIEAAQKFIDDKVNEIKAANKPKKRKNKKQEYIDRFKAFYTRQALLRLNKNR